MKVSGQYIKIVEWSEEDQCYVGTCPGLMLGGIHGDDEANVYKELCRAVEEWIEIYQEDKEPLPESTAGKEFPENLSLELAGICTKLWLKTLSVREGASIPNVLSFLRLQCTY